MTTIYLIRHAQAEGNLYRRCHGWYDGQITETGKRQIPRLEARFADIPIDAVYSSDLTRTMETAGAIYRPKGLPLRIDPDLREIRGGCWEDHTWGEWLHRDQENLAAFLNYDPSWSAPGSETFPAVRERMDRAIRRIAAAHPGQTAAVVSHGSAIRTALSGWLGCPAGAGGPLKLGDNTSVTRLEVEGGRVNLVYCNDNSHLGDLAFAYNSIGSSGDPLTNMVANSVYFEPLTFPAGRETYLTARRDGWMASHGTMEGFDGEGFLRVAERNSARDRDSILLAMLDGRPIGVLQMDFDAEAERSVGRVPFLYLMPGNRAKGLGAQLLGEAVSAYRRLGRKVLRLRCAPENDHAQKFYLSHGFRKVGEEPGGSGHLDTMEKYIGLNKSKPPVEPVV